MNNNFNNRLPNINLTSVPNSIKYFQYTRDQLKNGDMIIDIISQVRGVKSSSNMSLKTPVKDLKLSVNKDLKGAINKSIKDFKATLFIERLSLNDIQKDYSIDDIELRVDA